MLLNDMHRLQDYELLSPTDLNFLMEIYWVYYILIDSLASPLSVNHDAQASHLESLALHEPCANFMPGS